MVVEYRFEVVNYSHDGEVIFPATIDPITGVQTSPAVLLQRDSTTHYLLAGFDHAFSSRLSANFRGGAQLRDYENTVGVRTSPYFEGTVNYVLGKDTSVSWNAHYGIEEGDVVFNPTRTTFRTGVQGKHNLTARISASLSIYFDHDDYEGIQVTNPTPPPATVSSPAFTEDAFNIDLALRYAVTRYMGIQTGYDHSEVSSGTAGRDYSRNRVWGGINVAF
jgi:hypothetical protein